MRKQLVELMRSRVPELDRLQLMSIEASPNIAMAFDQGLRVLAISEAAAALHGQSPVQLVGEILPYCSSPDFVWAIERALECGLWRGAVAAMRFVACLIGRDGTHRHTRMAWTPVFVTGGEVVVCAQWREIDHAEYLQGNCADRLVVVAMEDLAVA